MLFMSCVCHAFTSLHCCLVATCMERVDLMALVVTFIVFLLLSNLYPGTGVVLDCIDS